MYDNIRKGVFLEGPNGPARYRTNIVVPLTENVREYQLEERATIENNFLVGIWVTKPGTVIEGGKTTASGAVLDSAFLTLRVGTSDVMRKVYLHQILAVNEAGFPYEVSIPGRVNLVESYLSVTNDASIVADTAIEFQVDFVVASTKGPNV